MEKLFFLWFALIYTGFVHRWTIDLIGAPLMRFPLANTIFPTGQINRYFTFLIPSRVFTPIFLPFSQFLQIHHHLLYLLQWWWTKLLILTNKLIDKKWISYIVICIVYTIDIVSWNNFSIGNQFMVLVLSWILCTLFC
jgi:hypothetical protein